MPVRMRVGNESLGIHLMVGFQGVTMEQELRHLIREFQIGGIVLFRRNIESPPQVKALLEEVQLYACEVLDRPLWVCVDQEGGPVQRLPAPFTQLPSARQLSAAGAGAIEDSAKTAAKEMREIGIHINLAPVLDLAHGSDSHFLAERSLGSDPYRVAELGALWIKTLQKYGVSATAKHYPGLGGARLDPHDHCPEILWENGAEWAANLLPFRSAIDAGVHCIMTSHARYPALDKLWPATLSPRICMDYLRDHLGFGGILMSDDLDMAAISKCYSIEETARQGFHASLDFFLICQSSASIGSFLAAMRDEVSRSRAAADMHLASISRIRKLALWQNQERERREAESRCTNSSL